MLRGRSITWERERVHTSYFGKLLGEGRFEFTLRYTICTFDRFKPAAGGDATHRDKIRCVLGVFPWTLCIARTGAVVFASVSHRSRSHRMKARTTHMFFRSSMTSRGDDCTLIREAYCTAFASILPTREVNDGRPLLPGGGCVMSPPDWLSV